MNPKMAQPMIQYPFETTISAVDMLLNRVPQTHPKCKIILSHAGGTLPFLVSRVGCGWDLGSPEQEDYLAGVRSFYYDIALSASTRVLNMVFEMVEPDHVLFGSDYPYATTTNMDNHIPLIATYNFGNAQVREGVEYKNALKLIPRLAQYYK